MKSNKSIIAFVCIATIIVMVFCMGAVEVLRGHGQASAEDGRENQLLRNIFSTISSFVKSLPQYLIDFIVFIFNAIIGGFFFFVSSITRTMTTAPTSTSPPTALSTSSAMTPRTMSAISDTTSMLTGPSSVATTLVTASTTATPVETTSSVTSSAVTSSALSSSATTLSASTTTAEITSETPTSSTTAASLTTSATAVSSTMPSMPATAASSTSTASSTGTTTTLPPLPPKLVFVTSTFFQPNFGGIEGADVICAEHAMAEGLNGTFLAWISNATASPSTRFVNDASPYILRNNETFASSLQSLLDNGPNISLRVTELGEVLSTPRGVFTNTENLGGVRVGNDDCDGWTSNSTAIQPLVGSTANALAWSNFGLSGSCARTFRLYCFQQ